MGYLEILAQTKKARKLANQSKRRLLNAIGLYSENRQAYFAAQQMSALANAARYSESLLGVVYREPILPDWLNGLTSFENNIFNSVYNERMGFDKLSTQYGMSKSAISQTWRSALNKVLRNIAPSSQPKLNITFSPQKPVTPGEGNWYVVHVKTGQEEAIAHNMRQNLHEYVTGAIATTTRVVTLPKNGFKIKENYETSIKGYIFIQAPEITNEIYYWAKSFTGVLRILSQYPISKEEVNNLLKLCNIGHKALIRDSVRIRVFLKEKCVPFVDIFKRGQHFFQLSLDLLQGIFGDNRAGPPPPLIEGTVCAS